jgi:16S rRNA (cytosine1402-N4)-methyltransferase
MHITILKNEIRNLVLKHNPSICIDFTFGAGGHSKIILECTNGTLISLDRDNTTTIYADNLSCNNFKFYVDISYNMHLYTPITDFILGDLGISQMQLNTQRGFSYKEDAFLNMQMGVDSLGNLYDQIQELSEYKIGEILREYGEEPQWRKIAYAIYTNKQKIVTSNHLKDIITSIVKYHPHKALSRCFQAFRIFINQELSILEKTLKVGYDLLKPNGVFAIITFHSLEDRIVKTFFKKKLINTYYIIPTLEEQTENPQCRSAKLRIGQKL